MNLLGVGYQMAGQTDKAITALSQLRDLSHETDPSMEVGAIANLATIHAGLGQNAKAEDLFKQAVEVKDAAPAVLAEAWLARGNWYAQTKDIIRALDSQEKAAKLYVAGNDFNSAANIYATIGVTYFNRGAKTVIYEEF